MKYNSFKQLQNDYSALHEQKKYKEALDLIENALESLPKDEFNKHQYTLNFDKAKFYAKSERYGECINTLKHLNQEGYVCPLHWGMFESLESEIGYSELKEKNDLLREREQEKLKV